MSYPAVKVCTSPKLLSQFVEANKLLESVQKGLADYLETKRLSFARFFFLSNDELLQILSQAQVRLGDRNSRVWVLHAGRCLGVGKCSCFRFKASSRSALHCIGSLDVQ